TPGRCAIKTPARSGPLCPCCTARKCTQHQQRKWHHCLNFAPWVSSMVPQLLACARAVAQDRRTLSPGVGRGQAAFAALLALSLAPGSPAPVWRACPSRSGSREAKALGESLRGFAPCGPNVADIVPAFGFRPR